MFGIPHHLSLAFLSCISFFHLSCSTLLYAAYSVAVSASDAEYFAEICRDLAQSLQSEAGRTACEAQDEVILFVISLFERERW